MFALLQHAQKLSEQTGGAFDITVAPLVRCWGFMGGEGRMPRPEEVAEARAKVGMHLVQLNPGDFTVRFAREGVMLDLGAIGKGYAIERAAEVLREAGVTSALLHGGTSSVQAIGQPQGEECWKIAIETPSPARDTPPALLATVQLHDEAMSVSGVQEHSFQAGGRTFGHVIDPRTGEPATGTVLAAVVLPSATETDALSTALLTLGSAGHEHIASLRPGMRTLVVSESGGQLECRSEGHQGAVGGTVRVAIRAEPDERVVTKVPRLEGASGRRRLGHAPPCQFEFLRQPVAKSGDSSVAALARVELLLRWWSLRTAFAAGAALAIRTT